MLLHGSAPLDERSDGVDYNANIMHDAAGSLAECASYAALEALPLSGARGFTCTVAVDDLAIIRKKVLANGGTISYEMIEIPTVGTLTQFLDTEGNELAAMVYDMEMFGA